MTPCCSSRCSPCKHVAQHLKHVPPATQHSRQTIHVRDVQDDDRARGISQADFRGILGAKYAPPFSDERWLDIRSPKTRAIMAKRFDFAKEIGCDGVDPDNTQANEVRRRCAQSSPRAGGASGRSSSACSVRGNHRL